MKKIMHDLAKRDQGMGNMKKKLRGWRLEFAWMSAVCLMAEKFSRTDERHHPQISGRSQIQNR